MATLLDITEVLATAMPVYPNFKKPAGDELRFFFTTWHRYAGHLERDVLQAALDKAVLTHPDFFPTPGHVLEAAAQIAAGEARTGLEAWGDVKTAMHRHGNYHPPVGSPYRLMEGNYDWQFDDPLVAGAVAALGWEQLFDGTEDTMRAHFVRAYDTMRLRQLAGALQLPGGGDTGRITGPRQAGQPVSLASLLEQAKEKVKP